MSLKHLAEREAGAVSVQLDDEVLRSQLTVLSGPYVQQLAIPPEVAALLIEHLVRLAVALVREAQVDHIRTSVATVRDER